jgi:hypothetical protein
MSECPKKLPNEKIPLSNVELDRVNHFVGAIKEKPADLSANQQLASDEEIFAYLGAVDCLRSLQIAGTQESISSVSHYLESLRRRGIKGSVTELLRISAFANAVRTDSVHDTDITATDQEGSSPLEIYQREG